MTRERTMSDRAASHPRTTLRRLGRLLGLTALPALLLACQRAEDRREAETTPSDETAGRAAETESVEPRAFGDPVLVVEPLKTPESVVVAEDGRYYVSLIGEFGKKGDGAIGIVDPESGAVSIYATGLDDPAGLALRGDTLYAADRGGVVQIAPGGGVSVLAPASAFPRPPQFLNDLIVDADGSLLVSDSGDLKSSGGAIFRIARDGSVSILAGSDSIPDLATVNGLERRTDGIYAVGFGSGALYRTDGRGAWQKLGDGFGSADGLAFDPQGRLLVTDHEGGKVLVTQPIGAEGEDWSAPRELADGLDGAADLTVDTGRNRVVVPALRGNRIHVYELPS